MTQEQDRIIVQNRIDFVTGAVRRYVADVDAIAHIGEGVSTLFAGVSAEAGRREPAPGEWSAVRTLGHLVVYAEALHDQLTRMAWMTDPVLSMVDDAAEAEREQWEAQDPHLLVTRFGQAIEEIESLLKHLPDSSWGRAGIHPLAGRRSIRQAVRRAAAHLEGHREQIEGALAASADS